jgi:hypothetical protein
MAFMARRDQVLSNIVAGVAAERLMMNFQIFH